MTTLAPPPHPKVLVCWSGGADSTLLLYHAARLYGTYSSPVRVFSMGSTYLAAGRRERAARKKILRVFKKWGLHISDFEITLDGPGLQSHGLPQAVLWLLATQALHEHESLGLGYVKGDDWMGSRDSFQNIFTQLQTIAGRTGVMWLPLIFTQKRGVLYQLKGLKLLDLIWWCQKGGKQPCGECSSCEAHETALWKLDKFGPGKYWEGKED